ncbi:hypothetical protein [Novosphingobium sp. BL-8A]|uniref:hypothetical protein n=1 Tax=Novosphingobium sp. BL-8A TaxID=3127639 RepID=UPI003756D286
MVKLEPLVAPAPELTTNPILLAAIVTFAGVLLTVVVGTIANFILARQRNALEKSVAEKKMEIDLRIARDKLAQELDAKNEARASSMRLRRIDSQRSILLELQDSVASMVRAMKDEENGHGDPRDYWEQNARFTIIITRVHDNEIRKAALYVRREFEEVSKASGDEAKRLNDIASQSLGRFLADVGDELRKLEAAEDKEVEA